ncbi:HD domain-containing phosphohydrolase [Bacillus spongiae]|uniref:HD domain-containing phosphohydrolase n=1 Tax=Bacillus spongiae TaxID=2683610 RepID=A0ABU8HFM0_9BACI
MEKSQISFDLIGKVLGEDIYSIQGTLLLKKGTIIKESHILLLQNHKFGQMIPMQEKTKKPLVSKNELEYDQFSQYLASEFKRIQDGLSLSNVTAILRNFSSLLEKTLDDIAITSLFKKQTNSNDYLTQHSIHVGILSAMIGKILSFSRQECILLGHMGLLHDIGMLKIPNHLVTKSEPLTTAEVKVVRSHTSTGYDMLKEVAYISPLIAQAALLHHERVDGSGYPMAIKESKIHIMIQIISVADVFNAICSDRPYSSQQPYLTAVSNLMNEVRSTKLNPAVVIPFTHYVMRQHLRQKVELNSGEVAEVMFIHQNEPDQPLIKVGTEYIDLRKHTKLKIVKPAP